MADDTTTTAETAPEAPEGAQKASEESVPYDRFAQANRKAKEAADRAKALEREMADIRRQMEEREAAGLPELEQLKKRLEAEQKRAEDNERKAAEADARVAKATKQTWVTAAAQAANFADPSDAAAFVNLDDIEDEKDAERAVKRLATAKKHLLKADEPRLPGKVLENGRAPQTPAAPAGTTAAADEHWAREVAPMLKQMVEGWTSTPQ